MKILLISPASGHWRGISKKRLFNGKTFRFSMLSLLTVAELSPEDAEIRIVDEQIENIPENETFDLVGITAMTAAAPRAYEIAARFRERGIPVVMGGFHATLNPAEALQHVDAVVVGCAAGAWQRVLADLGNGKLSRPGQKERPDACGPEERIYYGDPEAPIPASLPRHLVDRDSYVTVNSTYATLGCTNACRFCSIAAFHKGQRHQRDIVDLVSEIGSFRERFFMFVDDNLTQDRGYVVELLERLRPLGKKWVTQASIDVADDEELLTLMRDAGCIGLFIGIETFNERALGAQDKGFNVPDRYRAAVARIHRHGMYVEAGMIFGFDTDEPGVFRATLEMLDRIGIDAIQASILTPLPGTRLFEDMRDRLLDTSWERYDYRHVVFEPRRMSAHELQAGADWLIRKYYSPWRILKRLPRWLATPGGLWNFVYPMALSLAYYGRVKRFGIEGSDPAYHTRGARSRLSLQIRDKVLKGGLA